MASRFLVLYEGAMRLLRPSSLTLDPDGYADVHAKTADSAPPSGLAGGDLTGSYPSPDLIAIHAGLSGGSASTVPALTIDASGRTLTLTPTAIQITEAQVTNLSTDLSARVLKAGDTMTGPLGINRGGGAINATDLHVGAGNYSLAGAVSVRYEPVIASPGNYPRTQWFHPTYTGNVGQNAIALQIAPELAAGKTCPTMFGLGITRLNYGAITNWYGLYVYSAGTNAPTNNYDAAFVGGGNVGIGTDTPTALLHVTGTCKLDTSLSVGSGTAITKVAVYTPTLTPTLIAAAGLSEQTFTVTGLATSDTVTVSGPAATAQTALVHARVSAVDTLALTWVTMAAALTPTSGVYRILAVRS